MIRFALTIFTSAFLLFQVQPLIARYILPWFGGTPAVWSTCMLFFQLVLLAGYGYAHFLNNFFKVRMQALIHLVVVVAACLLLPIIPSDSLRPDGDESPVFAILKVLTATIGLPYFVVSTTGPLLQSWFAATYPGTSPYRLFALSNFGSLVALLTYPFLFEPFFAQKVQAYYWSGGFIVFALFCGWCALMIYADKRLDEAAPAHKEDESKKPAKYSDESQPDLFRVLLWIGLSAVPSILLLATTNQVCQEIAVVPFLWVLPLALYLVTFIICFEAPYLYIRFLFYPAFAIFIIIAVICLGMGVDAPMWFQAGGLILAFFFASMVCHGELACIKPASRYLTLYYLAVSIGGAVGGIFVVLIAPTIFNSYFELHVGLILALCLTAIAFHSRTNNSFFRVVDYRVSVAISAVLVIGLSIPIIYQVQLAEKLGDGEKIIYRTRDFWGILTVKRDSPIEDEERKLQLLNGRINHGNQYEDKRWRLYKTTYYCNGSGIGQAISRHPKRLNQESMRIGMIGLGTGTAAAWGETGDQIQFYEINPAVEHVAREYFHYLSGAEKKNGAKVEVILGDARIQMQRQLEDGKPQKLDVLGVDAFSSDAIPRHLLTEECVRLYEEHLAEGGIIAIHISNRFLDLEGICYRIGKKLNYEPILIECEPEDHWGYSNTWVLLTKNKDFMNDNEINAEIEKENWEIQWRLRSLRNFVNGKQLNGVGKELDFSTIKDDDGKETFVFAHPEHLDEFGSLLKGKDLANYTEKRKAFEKAVRQFNVLWTDDFGSLWQVIRLDFNINDTMKDVKEWWKEVNDDEEENEDSDE